MKYLKYPKLQVRPLWWCGFWNGPTSGILECENRKYWFEECDIYNNYPDIQDEEDDPGWCRRYTIHQLTPEELTEINEMHESFQTHVGTHTDFNEDWSCPGKCHANTNHQEFYDKDVKPRDYRNNKIIGWCEN